MTRKGYILLAALLLVAPGIAQADPIYSGSLTDPYSGTYTLVITDDGDANPDTYHATLTVDTNVVANAYIDWFTVHFDTPAGIITGTITATTGTWVVGTGDSPSQDVYHYGNGDFPSGNAFTGGFESGIGGGGSTETGGFLLNGNVYSWSFDFTADAPILGEGGTSDPNLQVGFYGSGVDGWPRLSQEFSVPEPGALLLLGSGLIGLAFARRKFRA